MFIYLFLGGGPHFRKKVMDFIQRLWCHKSEKWVTTQCLIYFGNGQNLGHWLNWKAKHWNIFFHISCEFEEYCTTPTPPIEPTTSHVHTRRSCGFAWQKLSLAVHGSPGVKKCCANWVPQLSYASGVLKSVALTSLFRCYRRPWECDRKPPWTTIAAQNREHPREILPSKLICMRAFPSVATGMQLKSATNLHKHTQYIFFMFNLYKMVFKQRLHEFYMTTRTQIMTDPVLYPSLFLLPELPLLFSHFSNVFFQCACPLSHRCIYIYF